jgi:hypothetical protein
MTIPDEVDIIVCGGGSCGLVFRPIEEIGIWADVVLAVLSLAVWPTWTTSSKSCSSRLERATSTTRGCTAQVSSRAT